MGGFEDEPRRRRPAQVRLGMEPVCPVELVEPAQLGVHNGDILLRQTQTDDLRAIAYHEAGHVVVGTRLGLEVLGADIERDGEGGRGHTHFAPAERTREFAERVVTTFMAGLAAEVKLGAPDPDGSGFDLDAMMREWLAAIEPDPARRQGLLEEYLRRAQRELGQNGAWAAVEAIAAALLQAGRLDADALRRLL